jgi:hypothetical protein
MRAVPSVDDKTLQNVTASSAPNASCGRYTGVGRDWRHGEIFRGGERLATRLRSRELTRDGDAQSSRLTVPLLDRAETHGRFGSNLSSIKQVTTVGPSLARRDHAQTSLAHLVRCGLRLFCRLCCFAAGLADPENNSTDRTLRFGRWALRPGC